jgi:hypothetical protein
LHEQVNDKTVAIAVSGTKMTARMLVRAIQAYLKKARDPTTKHGKQSLNSLTKHGSSLADIEIDGDNIGSFKKTARKYNIDFALKRDSAADPPRCIVFFKAKDNKALESAFNEYSKIIMKHKDRKPSMLAQLAKFKELAKSAFAPVKNRSKGEHEL